MSDKHKKTSIASDDAKSVSSASHETASKKTLDRRAYLKTAAAGAGAAVLGAPAIARAQNKTWKLKLQSNWTGIGIESQDRAVKMFVERVNQLSGGRIEVTNFDAEVLLGIGETFSGIGTGIADLAITASIYHRGTVPVGEFLWAVPFFPVTNVEFYESIYQFMGLKELWREAYAPHNVMHLSYTCSDEWGAMVSTKEVRSYADFKGMKVRAFGIWADWLVKNGASIVTIPGGEVYTAIQTKLIDAAAFGAPDAWAGMKVHEVSKYYINPSVAPYDITEVIMNLKTYNEMPKELQEVLLSAARVYNLDITALTVPTDARGRQILADGGMETILMPEAELREAAQWCWNQFLSKRGTMPHIDKMIDIYTKALEMHKAYYGPKQLPV